MIFRQRRMVKIVYRTTTHPELFHDGS